MNVDWFQLFLMILASFRLTRLIVFDTITQFIRNPFLEVVEEKLADGSTTTYFQAKGAGIKGFIGDLLSCYWCSGFWCSLIIVGGSFFYPAIMNPVIVVLAVAGGAAIVETILERIQQN